MVMGLVLPTVVDGLPPPRPQLPLPRLVYRRCSLSLPVSCCWLTASGSLSRPSSSPRALVYNFLILPYFLERLLGTGCAVCADCFLYLFTMLPFRVALLFVRAVLRPLRLRSLLGSSSALADVLRFALLALSWYWLSLMPMSRLYHYIRGQSVLKLYVLFNMLQISDRLFASIGEDILDALFSSLHLPLPYLSFHPAHLRTLHRSTRAVAVRSGDHSQRVSQF